MLKNRVREVREEKGVSLRTLADILGISPPYLSHIETGKAPLKRKMVNAMADALGCEPISLLQSDEDIAASFPSVTKIDLGIFQLAYSHAAEISDEIYKETGERPERGSVSHWAAQIYNHLKELQAEGKDSEIAKATARMIAQNNKSPLKKLML